MTETAPRQDRGAVAIRSRDQAKDSRNVRASGNTAAGPAGPASAGADQRIVLRGAVSGSCRDLRTAQHHQLRAWRALHGGGLRGVDAAELSWYRLLARADPRTADRRRLRDGAGTHDVAASLSPRSPVRAVANLRSGADHPGAVPQLLWRV